MPDTITQGLAYSADWENSKKRWEAFWQHDVYDRPVMLTTSPRDVPLEPLYTETAYVPCFKTKPELEFYDKNQMLKRTLSNVAKTAFFGEAIPAFDHRWSVAQVLAWGCIPAYNENAAWCHPLESLPDENTPLYADETSEGWRWMFDTAGYAVSMANRNFFVRPDWGNHTGDILATIIGNYELLTMIIDDKTRLKRMIDEVTCSLNKIYKKMYAIVEDSGNEGTVNYIGCWSPNRSICMDCDISCMISPGDFNELFLEPLIETMLEATHRMYHLDGPGALKHLPTLLGIKELHGIQWVPGAGKEPITQWIPILKQIQDAGKTLWININEQELPLIQKELSPAGLCISVSTKTEDDARRLIESGKKVSF